MPESMEQDLFAKCRKLSTASERADFLERACGDDAKLRAKVERLLAAAADSGNLPVSRPEEMDTLATSKTGERTAVPSIVVSAQLEPGQMVDNYEIIEKIGEGGFGLVFQARQVKPIKREVAIKIIKLGMDTRAVVERFETERQALALMEHPNIAKVFDAGETASGRPYFVMELVSGMPITQFCDDRRFSSVERLELFVEVCHALDHAHEKGIVHRDIKPTNVLVSENAGCATPKIIDFGIAKATAQDATDRTALTLENQFIGSPIYMSPEQAKGGGEGIDRRSDIYSLGVLLYELLTGRTPFDATLLKDAGFAEICRIIREEEPPRPSRKVSTLELKEQQFLGKKYRVEPQRVVRNLSGDIDWIVMKALTKEKERRYPNAGELATDITRHLQDRPVSASPPSVSYLVGKYMRRKRGFLSAMGSVTIAFLIGAYLMRLADPEGSNVVTRVTTAAKNSPSAIAPTRLIELLLEGMRASSEQPWGLASDGDHLWLSDCSECRIYKYNKTGQLQDAFAFAPGKPTGLAFHDGILFVAEDRRIHRLDAQSWEILSSITLPKELSVGAEGLAFGQGILWFSSLSDDGRIMGIDPTTGEILKNFKAPGEQPRGLTYFDGSLWSADSSAQRIFRLNPAEGSALTSATLTVADVRGLSVLDGRLIQLDVASKTASVVQTTNYSPETGRSSTSAKRDPSTDR